MVESVSPYILRASHDSPLDSQRLRVRTDLKGYSSLKAKVSDYSATISENSLPMAVIDEHHCIMFLGEFGNLVEGCDVTVHAEYTVGDDQLPLTVLMLL